MGFLTPLYIAGLAALSLPILFHLIRRTPRGRQNFSSLMFLAPSPPRLTRRSKIDQWLLLILRGLALTLLATAFARPFLREAADLLIEDAPGRRVAILVDTSASMQRGGVWQQAVDRVAEVIDGLEAADDVSLFVFDDHLRQIVKFDKEQQLTSAEHRALLQQRVRELSPTWRSTDLGLALAALADQLDDREHAKMPLQIMVITDLQQGTSLEALQAYEWPQQLRVAIHPIEAQAPSNGTVRLLTGGKSKSVVERVRITNAGDSTTDQFYVAWASPEQRVPTDRSLAVYVPAGQSRVVRLPRGPERFKADRIVLRGDTEEFDNTCFVTPKQAEQVRVLFIDQADDQVEGLQYYFQEATGANPRRDVTIVTPQPSDPLQLSGDERPHLAIVAIALSADRIDGIREYLRAGGSVLLVPKDQAAAMDLQQFVDRVDVDENKPSIADGSYAMLGDIDFTHPVFATFANPRYNDFTHIHFWKFRQISIQPDSTARVVARFDNGNPALFEQTMGAGRLMVLASSWHPEDSELARSTKFVPLIDGILRQATGHKVDLPRYVIGEHVRLPERGALALTVTKPDGSTSEVARDATVFRDTDTPGIYRLRVGDQEQLFAVNVAPAESKTAPLDLDAVEQYGVKLGLQISRTEENERRRQERREDLERRQKLWRWCILAAVCVLMMETWVASRTPKNAAVDQD